MSTVDKATADKVIAYNGVYPGDEYHPPIILIIEYDNAWGGQGYGMIRESQFNRYVKSNYIRNPRVYWKRPV